MKLSEIREALRNRDITLNEDKHTTTIIIVSDNDDVNIFMDGDYGHLMATITERIINHKQFRQLIMKSLTLAATKDAMIHIEFELECQEWLKNGISAHVSHPNCLNIVERIVEQLEENNPVGCISIYDRENFDYIRRFFPALITGDDYKNIISECFEIETILKNKGLAHEENEKSGYLYRYILNEYLHLEEPGEDGYIHITDALADFVKCDDLFWFSAFSEILEPEFREKVRKEYLINSLTMHAGSAIMKSLTDVLIKEGQMRT